LLELANGLRVGAVFPDAYALDASNAGEKAASREGGKEDISRVRITLLRSPLMAHHYPFQGEGPRGVYADQGMHEFRFRFFAGPQVTGELLDRHALILHRPLVSADWTKGMPAH
jgi:hypothetical protein